MRRGEEGGEGPLHLAGERLRADRGREPPTEEQADEEGDRADEARNAANASAGPISSISPITRLDARFRLYMRTLQSRFWVSP